MDLSSLKQKLEEENNSSRSRDNTKTPLFVFLEVYNKAGTVMLYNYMEGAMALFNYLRPFDFPFDKYPEADNTDFVIPPILKTYELDRLSRIFLSELGPFTDRLHKLSTINRVEKLLYLVTVNEVQKTKVTCHV